MKTFLLAIAGLLLTATPTLSANPFGIVAVNGSANRAFSPAAIGRADILRDLPTASQPDLPILGRHQANVAANMRRVEELLAAFRASGIDYLDVHWFETDHRLMDASVTGR